MSLEPVLIEERLIDRVGVREWGLPTLVMPGQIWRSEKHKTTTCMLPAENSNKVSFETRDLKIISVGEMSWLPDLWRDALWEYVQAWPSSGCKYGPFLRITESERCNFIRKLADDLVKSIGQFAALDYELPSDQIPF